MVILILTPNFPASTDLSKSNAFGGAIIYGEAISLRKTGAEVIVLTPDIPGALNYEIDIHGIKIIRFRYFVPEKFQKIRLPNRPIYSKDKLFIRLLQIPFFLFSIYFSLYKIIRSVDIIYANWTQSALLALPFKWLFNKPIFLILRGSDLRIFPFRINRFIIEKVDGVFSWPIGYVSKIQNYVKGNYFKIPIISRISMSQNKRLLDNNIIRFLFVGRLVTGRAGELKGIPILISTIKILSEKYNFFHIDILGDGPYKDNMIDECRNYNLDRYITFHGYQNLVHPFLQKSDAVIGCAGLNAVAQEVAYSECLLILPNISILIGDIWIHMQNSLLYETMNSLSLAQAMEYVIKNRENCKKIASEGKKSIKDYVKDIDNAGRYYIDAFQKIVDNNKRKNITD